MPSNRELLKKVQNDLEKLTALEASLKKILQAEEELSSAKSSLDPVSFPSYFDSSPESEPRGQSNVKRMETILLANGQPMHIKEIAKAALSDGWNPKGRRPPHMQIRSALLGSKRFELVGSNYWWVANVPLPEPKSQTLPLAVVPTVNRPDPPYG